MAISSAAIAASELARLRQLDAAARLTGAELAGPERPQPGVVVVQHVTLISAPAPPPAAPAPPPPALHLSGASTAPPSDDFGFGGAAAPLPTAPSAPALGAAASAAARATPSASPATLAEDDVELPLTESVSAELRRLEATVHDLTDTNDRIMAQNIALLADLEVAQKAVRELRAEKDALATQVRRVLTAAAAASGGGAGGGAAPAS
jgi:hypothetical protein